MLDIQFQISVVERAELESIVSSVNDLGIDCDTNEVKGSDGGASVIVEVFNFVSQALPHILTFLLGYLAQGKVKRIKIGSWEIENPDEDMLDLIKMKMQNELDAGNNDQGAS